MDAMLCPQVIGRAAELQWLTDQLDAAAGGEGRLVAVVGEAGVGKSRLARSMIELAAARSLRVLCGRAVPCPSPVPFRPLSEALVVACRDLQWPVAPELARFERQLARLLPGWADRVALSGLDESPVLVGEAMIRLLEGLGGDRGCLLVLEDLQWADPETLAVVEYLADALLGERVLALTTARPERGSLLSELLQRVRRRSNAVLPLEPLSAADCERMVCACLSAPSVPAELTQLVVSHCDGLPFLVEELLAGLVASGALVRRDGSWRTERTPTPMVPGSLAESVYTRLRAFDPAGRQVLAAAAVLGRCFDWQLVPGVADVDGAAAVAALRQAVDAQLVTVLGQEFRFRHALTREAVLAELLPPELALLAARALVAVERAHPGLPDVWCELAGDLAEAAGDLTRAAVLLTRSARRALERGALATSESTAQRALDLAPSGSSEAADAMEVLVRTLAHAGKPGRALAIGLDLLTRFDQLGVPSGRRRQLLLVLARAALAKGDAEAAEADLARARVLDADADAGALAELDSVAAHVALARAREDEARALAASAVERARPAGLAEVECEALEVLGRLTERWPERLATFERAAQLAGAKGLTTWRLRALQELALAEAASGTRRVREVRAVAAEAGAFVTVAQMDLSLADMALGTFDHGACLDAAERCVDASRRFALASLPVALLWLAGAHALAGRESDMEAALSEAVALSADDPRILADLWGRVRASLFMLREDRRGLRDALDRSMEYTRLGPDTQSVYPGQMYWALLGAMCDDDYGEAARAEFSRSRMVRSGFGRPALALIDAVVLGRRGRCEEAAALAAEADADLTTCGGRARSMYFMRIVAEAAARDGWGDPGGWLREAEAYFAERGHDRVVRECRRLLQLSGAPSSRRGRGASVVPPALRRFGITSRELDVLRLVATGRSTPEIAGLLVLSPRTVEHHLASLLSRTGRRSRRQLIEFARLNRVDLDG